MKKSVTSLTLLGSLLFSASSFAHPTHVASGSFAEGFLHPLTGLDHLFALVLMGLFAATCTRQVAARFVGYICAALLAGFILGTQWANAHYAESLVSGSLLLLPVCFFGYRRSGLVKLAAVVAMGVFSLSHGLVQGAEAQGILLQYAVGTMFASVMVIGLVALVSVLAKQMLKALHITA